jgi:hypothetical protein
MGGMAGGGTPFFGAGSSVSQALGPSLESAFPGPSTGDVLGALGGGLTSALSGFGKSMSAQAGRGSTPSFSGVSIDTPQYTYTPIPVAAPSLGTGTYGPAPPDTGSPQSGFAETQDTSFMDFVNAIADRMRARQSALPGSTVGAMA